jgi:uncharacterized membrane protein YkvA (DUF1232 family)
MNESENERRILRRFDEVRREFWGKLRASLARIGFAREAMAAYYCAIDPATPTRVRAILLGALAYFIAPVDALPDFVTGLGFTDDAAVLMLAWRSVAEHITDSHRARADAVLVSGRIGDDTP